MPWYTFIMSIIEGIKNMLFGIPCVGMTVLSNATQELILESEVYSNNV